MNTVYSATYNILFELDRYPHVAARIFDFITTRTAAITLRRVCRTLLYTVTNHPWHDSDTNIRGSL
jgi:hypothetical protein